ncbi:thioredoxin domain-containing protein [Sinorhizobium meliloti]|nr:thioredoxin domain-containing protein [Sinorhizobium meliloti]
MALLGELTICRRDIFFGCIEGDAEECEWVHLIDRRRLTCRVSNALSEVFNYADRETAMKAVSRALVLATMLIPSAAHAQQSRLSDEDRRGIVNEVIEHFRKNPEELVEAIAAAKRPEAMAGADAFVGSAVDPWYGPADAPISIMVFSDYGCAPCNDVEKILDRIAASRGDVKIVHRDYPVSGEHSVAASLDIIQAFNAKPQVDWMKLRRELMEKGVAPEYRIEALRFAGVDQSAEASAAVKLTLLKNRELARRAGVSTLPAVIVMKGDGVVPISGDVTEEGINEAIRLLSEH